MTEVKVVCGCGQKYKFEVEPVHGRMPAPVNCPACGADGTVAANAIIAQSSPPPAFQPSAPRPAMTMPVGGSLAASPPVAQFAPARAQPQPAPAPEPVAAAALAPVASLAQAQVRGALGPALAGRETGDGDTWKWWYYVLAGVCFAGYDIWRAYDTHRLKPLGGLFLSVILIAIGFWQRSAKKGKA
jgi:hypothetical protein